MALAINSEMAADTGAQTTAASLTYSFTNTSGTLLHVGATYCEQDANRTISTVTYNGTGLTKIDNQSYGADVDVWLGSLLSPATGPNNVVVTPSGGTGKITSGAISWTGHHATVYNGTPAKASGTSATATVNVTGTATGNYVIDVAACGTGFTGVGASQTLSWRANIDDLGAGNNGQSSYEPGNGGTVTMSETAGGSDSWGIVAVEVLAAAGAATKAPPPFHRTRRFATKRS